MGGETRYELLEKIGSGSFASVYRAKDLELEREVAVKEIHAHFREDPQTLDRYWSEAQLLASLPHPNIVTIFDIDRDRGWLIMELMQTNLAERMSERQMNLRSLRTTVAHCLRALKYLHSRGVVHGDIKPGNMMIDSRKRIKIGDFGLARRVSDDEGSLLKGTTKYMAPEVVSEDFGEVTSASDLYSLGFSAYELMCGRENFENLFPGLSAFGRDKQAAWMMWHAASDRRLPEIHRTLQGVPEDLAKVIEKLTEKDPANRYQSADEALSDLEIDVKLVGKKGGDADGDSGSQKDKAPKSDKTRLGVIVAFFIASLAMSMFMLFQDNTPPNKLGPDTNAAKLGIIREISLDENLIVIEDPKTGVPEEFELGKRPKIYLENDKQQVLLRQLKVGDRVEVSQSDDEEGMALYSIVASRPISNEGYLKSLEVMDRQITIAVDQGTFRGDVILEVPERAKLTLNGDIASLSELLTKDRVDIEHLVPPGRKGTRELVSLDALRRMTTRGYIKNLDVDSKKFTLRFGKGRSSGESNYKISDKCKVTNRKGETLALADLKAGDRIEFEYDIQVHEIEVSRGSSNMEGTFKSVAESGEVFKVQDNAGKLFDFSIGSESEVTLGLVPVSLSDLREFDTLEIQYEEPEEGKRIITTLDATRPVLFDRWAIVIGTEAYQEKLLSPLPFAIENARAVYETLHRRYAFSKDRISLLLDEDLKSWKGQIKEKLEFASNSPTQVIIYISGHAYLSPGGKPYFAPVDFQWDKMEETGLSFEWLAEQLEQCKSKDKILLYDCTNAGQGKDIENELSAETMFSKINKTLSFAVIGNSSDGQRGQILEENKVSLFANSLSKGFGGAADADKNVRISPEELIDYLKEEMSKADLPAGVKQTPVLLEKAN